MCAPQAIEFHNPEKLGKGTETAYLTIRKVVLMLKEDGTLSKDIEKIGQIVKNGKIINEIKKTSRPRRKENTVAKRQL